MLNDFLPAMVSVGVLACAFLFVWISDVRRMRRLEAPEFVETTVPSMLEIEGGEELSLSAE
jgi:hypothetical protein